MRTLIALVGVRGAGKSTLQASLHGIWNVVVLIPSTTRQRRALGDSEYDFVQDWQPSDMAWEIEVGGAKYGMQRSQLEAAWAKGCIAVTVFDPSGHETLTKFRGEGSFEVITVGLDTVDSIEVQHDRVERDPRRALSEEAFKSQREIVQSSDIVLSGGADRIFTAFEAILRFVGGRGGILDGDSIRALIDARALIEDATSDSVQTASYDLRLGDHVWCQGRFIHLTDFSPALTIPPYSYAIVSAHERAKLPKILAGRFDLKVSLFFQGVILSNGPQVNPGYNGSLFCMLYNSSDQNVGLMRGHHFATIEFITTCTSTRGYHSKYQAKSEFRDFMPGHAAVGHGGKILERVEELKREWDGWKLGLIAYMGLGAAFLAAILAFPSAFQKSDDGERRNEVLIQRLNSAEQKISQLVKELEEEQKRRPRGFRRQRDEGAGTGK